MFRRKRASAPQDPGLQQIDAWLKGFTAFNAERLRGWPDGPVLDAERATVAALGTAMVTAMRSDYLARQHR
jgi:hypothetical protein